MSVSEKFGIPSDFPVLGWFLNQEWYIVLLISWALSPFMHYVIAAVLEKRLAPIWRYQFWSFFPGDLFLGVTMAMSVELAREMPVTGENWYQGGLWNVNCLVIGAAFCFFLRKIDGEAYGWRQLNGPTKIYHDFVMGFGFAALLARVGVPSIFYGGEAWKIAVSGMCFIIWSALGLIDQTQPKARQGLMRSRTHNARGFAPCWSKDYSWINDNRPLPPTRHRIR